MSECRGLLRGLLRGWLLWLAWCVCTPALAQRLPQPAPRHAADVAAPVEVATTAWSREQLEAWWVTLRRQAVEATDRLNLPAELLPPEATTAWQAVAMPDVRARPGAAVVPDTRG
jgi:hypothetical protein